MSRVLVRAALSLATAGVLLAAAPRSARADPSQLCRAFSTVLLSPTDVALAPYISARDAYGALSAPGEPFRVWISFLPAYPFFLTIQTGGAVIRAVAGTFEIVPGLIGLASDKAGPPLFAQQDQARQVYSADPGPCPVRVGSSYWSILSGGS